MAPAHRTSGRSRV
ncbi:TPA_asm: UL36.6 uORF [Human alphaherpesvirus 1]|nr:TPA_asm: UL36.6 uORF [Human alphaherpesvirus 1]